MSAYGQALKSVSGDAVLLSKLTNNLTIQQTLNKISIQALTKEKIEEMLVNKGLTQTEAEAIAIKITSASANGVATFSLKAYTTAILANIKAMGTMILASPITMILGIVGAISAVIFAFNHFNVTIEEQKEKIAELKSEYKNTKDEIEELGKTITTNEQRILDLKNKLSEGTITLIEEDELERLALENRLLIEQKKVKEDLAKIDAQELSKENRKLFEREWGSDIESEYKSLEDIYVPYSMNVDDSYIPKQDNKKLMLSLYSINEQIDDALKQGNEDLAVTFEDRRSVLQKELDKRFSTILEGYLEQQDTLTLLMNEDGTFNNPSDQIEWDKIESWKKELYSMTGRAGEWNTLQLGVTLNDSSLTGVKKQILEKLNDGTLTETDIEQYPILVSALKDANLALEAGETPASVYLQYLRSIATAQTEVNTSIPDFSFNDSNSELIDNYQSSLSALSEAMDKLRSGNMTDSDLVDLLQMFPDLMTETDNLSQGIDSLITDKLDALKSRLKELGASDEILVLFDKITAENRNLSLDETLSALQNTNSMIKTVEKEITDVGKISVSTLQNIASQYPILKKVVDDYLEGKIKESDLLSSLKEQYETDLGNYKLYMAQKKGEDTEFYKLLVGNLSEDLINKASSYGIELKNYSNYLTAKLEMDKIYAEKRAELEKANEEVDMYAQKIDNEGAEIGTDALEAGRRRYVLRKEVKDIEDIIAGVDTSIDITIPDFRTDLPFDKDTDTDSDKDDFSEQIDWIAESVTNANKEVERLDTALSNATGFQKRLKLYEDLFTANQNLIDTTKNAADEYEDIWKNSASKIDPKYIDLITSSGNDIDKKYNETVQLRKAKYSGSKYAGNVDLYNRPILFDNEGYYETLKSETYNYSDFGINKKGAFNVTPILPDGTKIENLEDYILNQLKNGKSLEDLDVFMGGDYSSIDEAVNAAIALHEEQDAIYGAEASYLQLLKEGNDLSIETFTDEDIYDKVMAAKEAYDTWQESLTQYEDALQKQIEDEKAHTSLLLSKEEIKLEIHELEDQETMTASERNEWLKREVYLKGEILKYNLALAETEKERNRLQKEYDQYLLDAEEQEYQNEREERSYSADYYGSQIQDIQNEIALAEAQNSQGTEEQYNTMNEYLGMQKEIYEQDLISAQAKRDAATYGTAKWNQYNEEMQEAEDNINQCTLAQIENNKAIILLPVKQYEDANKLLEEQVTIHTRIQQKIESAIGYATSLIQEQVDALNESKETITDNYDEQIKAIQEQKDAFTSTNDEIQKQMDLQKAKYNLEKALSQKSVRIYRKSEGFVYEADANAVADAQSEIDQLEYDIQVDAFDKEINRLNTEKEDNISAIDEKIKSWQEYAEQLDKVSSSYERMISERDFYELFNSSIYERLLSQDSSVLEVFQTALNTEKSQLDGLEQEIETNNESIKRIQSEAEAYVLSAGKVVTARGNIKIAVTDNKEELLAIDARKTKVDALSTEWDETKLNIETVLKNLNTSQTTAKDSELLILQERINNLTTFKTKAVSLYGEIANAVTGAQTAFNNLSTILENAKSTKDEINSVVSKTTTTKTTTTTNKVKTTSSENAGSIIKNGVKLSKYHDGGIVGTGKKLPENLIALTDTNLAPNETIAKLLKGEVVLNQMQMGNMFDNLGRAYSSLITPLNKRENSSMEISIGDVNVYNPSNTDMIVDEIVKELPLKVVQRLHSK